VRFVGALLFLFGAGATAYCTAAAYTRGRPKDVLFGLLAPVAVLLALVGLLLVFVPGFFG
jgi:hypothetical protein